MNPTGTDASEPAIRKSQGPFRRADLKWYGLTTLLVGAALGSALVLQHFSFRDAAVPLLLFACAISSWYGGRGPAVLAASLSIIGFYWYFIEPVRTIYIYTSEIPYFIIFVAFVWLMSWFSRIRRRAEDGLRKQANLLSLTHDAVFVMDMGEVIQYWNRGAAERYGWRAEEAVGRVVHDLLKTVFPLPLEEIKAELMRTGRWEGELEHTKQDGTQVVVASRWALQRDERGAPVAILETNNDITEHKRAERALQDSEASLNRAQEIAHIGSWHLDIARNKLIWSNEVHRMFDIPPGTALSYGAFLERVHPEDRESVDRAWSAALRGAPYDIEHRILAGNELKWVRERAVLEFDPQGKPVSGIGTVHDITERRRAEEALRRSEAYLADAERINRTGTWAWNPASGIQYWSKECYGMMGFDPAEGVPRLERFLEAVHPEDLPQVRERLQRVAGEKTNYEEEYRIIRPSGEVRHFRVIGHPVFDTAGNLVEYIGTTADVTERKQAEEALRRLNRELRALSNCNQTLLRATDEQHLLEEICRIVREEAGYDLAWVSYVEHDEAKSMRPVAWAGTDVAYLTTARISWSEDTDRGRGPTGMAVRSGKTCYVQDFATDARVAPWRETLLQGGFRSAIALPLKDENGKALGSLTIHSAQPDAFPPEEIWLLEELAADLAFGIVTLRSRAARQRAEQEVALLSFALNNVREAAYLLDERARFLYVNEEACRALGYTRTELLGMSVPDIDPCFPEERWSDHWRAVNAQRFLSFESQHRTKDGRVFPVEISANYLEYGGAAYNLALVRDISERKRAEQEIKQQEMELRQVLDFAPQLIAVFGPGRERLYASQPALDYLGVTLEEWKSIPDRSWFYHPDDRQHVEQDVYAGLSSDVPHEFEARMRRKDGVYRWFLIHDNPLHDGEGRILRWYITGTDIEDRKRTEEERKAHVRFLESMDRINRAMQGTNDLDQMTGDVFAAMLSIFDSDRVFLYYPCDPDAPSFVVVMARTRPEYPAACGSIPMTPDTARGFQMVLAAGGVVTFGPGCDHPLVTDFARRFTHQSSIGVAIYPKEDKPWVLTMHQCSYPRVWTADERRLLEEIARRVTDSLTSLLMFRRLREGEQALRRNEGYLAESQRLTRTGSWAQDATTRQSLYWSEETFRIWGFDPQQGLPAWDEVIRRIHPQDLDKHKEATKRALVEKLGLDFEYRIVLPDGIVKHLHTLAHPVLSPAGEVLEVVGTTADITERKRAEEALHESETRFRAFVDHAADALFVLDFEQKTVLDVNRCACESLGCTREELIGTSTLAFDVDVDPAFVHSLAERAAAGETVCDMHWHRRKDGTVFPVEAHTSVYSHGGRRFLLKLARDITDRWRAEEALREQANLLNLTHDTIFVMDMEGVVKYWNRGAEERYGWPAEQVLGRVVHDLLNTAFPAPLDRIKVELKRTGRWEGELVHLRKDGTPVVVASRWALQRDEQGAPVAILETNNDITERKRSEEALRLSGAYNRSLIEASLDPLVTIGPEGKITDVNAATEVATGRFRGELIGTDFCDYFTEPAKARAGYEQAFREGLVHDYPLELRHRDGHVISVLYNASVYRDESGQVVGVFAAARDITERKRAEEALRLSGAYNRSLIEASLDPLVTIGPDGKITDVNAATEAATGRSRGELIGTDFCDYFTEPAKARAGYEQVFREGLVHDYPLELRHRDGHVISVLYNASVYRDESGQVVGVFAAARDITEAKRAEEALRRSEAYLVETQRLAHVGAWAADVTTEPVYWSEEEFRIFERDPRHGLPTRSEVLQLIHQKDADKYRRTFQRMIHDRVDADVEFRIVLPDGTVKHAYGVGRPVLNADGDVVELVGTTLDITDRKRAEQERERLHQLEADLAHINRVSLLGELAASIAHEVNQPLSGVVSNGGACLRWLAADPPNVEEAREAVRRIVAGGKHAGEVIKRIRALTTRVTAPEERLDLNETIREVLVLVGDEAKKHRVAIRTRFADDLSPVVGDRVQLQQVVLNLVMNGIEAMSNVSERARELVITTRNMDTGQVQATLADSGVGLDSNTVGQIFDAFYTTKPGGMGMGLSISRSIIRAHGGRLWATANDGPGTMFHFTLPEYHKEEPNEAVAGV